MPFSSKKYSKMVKLKIFLKDRKIYTLFIIKDLHVKYADPLFLLICRKNSWFTSIDFIYGTDYNDVTIANVATKKLF